MNITAFSPEFVPPSVFLLKIPGVLGLAAFLTNLTILGIFLHNRRLRRCSALLICLIGAHVLNGLAHSVMIFSSVKIGYPVTKQFCIKMVWPIIYISVYQILPLVLAVNALERLLASGASAWYHNTCTRGRLWSITAIVLVIGLVIVLGNIIKLSFESSDPITSTCFLMKVFGEKYMCYGVHVPAILGGVLSVIFTGISVGIGRIRLTKFAKKRIKKVDRMRREIRLTKCLLLISVMDVVFVVVPNFILLLFNLEILNIPTKFIIYPIIIYSSNSLWNVPAFLLYNKKFRKELMKLMRIGR